MSITEHNLRTSLPEAFDCQGIYAIKSVESGKSYVGSSVNIRNRINSHINHLNNKETEHHSKALQRAWNKYKQEGFIAVVLEIVIEKERLIEKEQFWIDKLGSFKNGYNGRPIAEANYGMIWTEEQNELRRINNKKAWLNEDLRIKLSKRFKGEKRGKWTKESHKKTSISLKKAHEENPEWKLKIKESLQNPEVQKKRLDGVRKSLEDADVYNKRVNQLKEASKKVERLNHLRKSYFMKHELAKFGITSLKEFENNCIELYNEGNSLRMIGNKFNVDHKSISSLLKRLGVKIEMRYCVGDKNKSTKLNAEDVKKIKDLLNNGYSAHKLASEFGVKPATIYDIKNEKSWRYI